MTAFEDLPAVPFEQGDDIAARIRAIARAQPEALALIDGESRVSWRELDVRIDRVACALARAGLGRGSRVAVLARNSAAYVEVLLGTLRVGGSVVPLPTMATASALGAMLADAACSGLFVGDEYRELGAELIRNDHGKRCRVRVAFGAADAAFSGFDQWASGAGGPFPHVPITGRDEFDVIYSSGTTGTPKGIVHTHGARKASYAGSRARFFTASSINAVATPFYSNTTCITWLLTTAAGGCNVVMRKFDAGAFLRLVGTERITHAMLVPVQYDRILQHPEFDAAELGSLRYQFSTSAPLRADLKRAILDRTPGELIEIYGTTEGGVVCMLEARRHPDKLASVGCPVAACTMKILDESGTEVGAGQTGEVVGRCPNMASGYLGQPEATRAMQWRDVDGQLFYRSGDIGRFDSDGFLFLLDRKKDVIISGGLNIYATDIEAVLLAHTAVTEAAVVGVPSERWGETPWAFVVKAQASQTTESELVEWCNARLGKSQRLSGLEFVATLPKNAIGKVLKRQLRTSFCARLGA